MTISVLALPGAYNNSYICLSTSKTITRVTITNVPELSLPDEILRVVDILGYQTLQNVSIVHFRGNQGHSQCALQRRHFVLGKCTIYIVGIA